MFLTPYQTTACSLAVGLPSIQSALQRAFIHDEMPPAVTPKGHTLKGVYLVPPYLKDIKPFTMPLTFETADGERLVAVDVRGITKPTGDRTFRPIDPGAYEGTMLRGALTYGWIDGGVDDMRRWNDIAVRVYMRLLCETIVRRLNLTPADQQAVYVACGFFYYTNFIHVNPETGQCEDAQNEKDRIAVAVARMTRINPQKVHDLLNEVEFFPTDLDKFCDVLRSMVKNPRLEQLSAPGIITLMGGYWYGGNARQVMAVSLEYPPVWMALIYQALMDRNYHGSQLSKMVEAENRNNTGTQFIRDVGSFLEILSDE